MAGEFDPLGGDLYSIMGGVPGGGPMGSMAAGSMFQQNLQEQAAKAEFMRQQAEFQKAQAGRTTALTQPEVEQTRALAGLYGGQTQRLGAETQQLNLGNIARDLNLTEEVKAAGAKYGAEIPEAQLKAWTAKLVPAMSMAPTTFSNAPNPELAIDTWGAQAGLSKEPHWADMKQKLKEGVTPQQYLTGLLSANPEQIRTETQAASAAQVEQLKAGVQREVARMAADRAVRVAQINEQAKIMTAGSNNPEGAVRSMQNQITMARQSGADPAEIGTMEANLRYAQQRVDVLNGLRQIAEAAKWTNAQWQTRVMQMFGADAKDIPMANPQVPSPLNAIPNNPTPPSQVPGLGGGGSPPVQPPVSLGNGKIMRFDAQGNPIQ